MANGLNERAPSKLGDFRAAVGHEVGFNLKEWEAHGLNGEGSTGSHDASRGALYPHKAVLQKEHGIRLGRGPVGNR